MGELDRSLLFYHYNDDRDTKVTIRNNDSQLFPAPVFRLGTTRHTHSSAGRLSASTKFSSHHERLPSSNQTTSHRGEDLAQSQRPPQFNCPEIGALSSFAPRRAPERLTKYHAVRKRGPLCSRPNMSSSERLLDRYCNKRLMKFYRKQQPSMMKNVRRLVSRNRTTHTSMLRSIAAKYEQPDLGFYRVRETVEKRKKNIYARKDRGDRRAS